MFFFFYVCQQTEVTKKGRSKGRGSRNVNIKNSPINIKDGDYLGVKVRRGLIVFWMGVEYVSIKCLFVSSLFPPSY